MTAAVAGQLERLVRPRAAVKRSQQSRVIQALSVERRALGTGHVWVLCLLNTHSTAVKATRKLAEANVDAPAATPSNRLGGVELAAGATGAQGASVQPVDPRLCLRDARF